MATIKMDSSGYTIDDKGSLTGSQTVTLTPGVWSKLTWSPGSGGRTIGFNGTVLFVRFQGTTTNTSNVYLSATLQSSSASDSFRICAIQLV